MNNKLGAKSRRLRGLLLISAFAAVTGLADNATHNGATTWTAPPRAARKQNPIPANEKTLAEGKQLFIASCLPCHGSSGRGDGPAAISLERNGSKIRPGNLSDPKMREQTDGAIFWKITEGNPPMPTFGQTLSEEQRWQIVNYVRTLAR